MTEKIWPVGPHLVLGTAQFDATYGIGRQNSEGFDTCQILALAEKIGITTLDTAPAYANAQERIKFCGWRGSVHTKIPGDLNAQKSLEDSLRNLGRDCVEVAYFHDPRVLRRNLTFFEHIHSIVVPTLTEHLGISIYSVEEFKAALANPFINVIQAPMNIVDHRISDRQIKDASLKGKRVYARSVFLQGALLQAPTSLPGFLSKLVPVVKRLDTIAVEKKISRLEILFQSVLARTGIAGVVVGVESPGQLEEIVSAFDAPRWTGDFAEIIGSLRLDDLDVIDPRAWPRR